MLFLHSQYVKRSDSGLKARVIFSLEISLVVVLSIYTLLMLNEIKLSSRLPFEFALQRPCTFNLSSAKYRQTLPPAIQYYIFITPNEKSLLFDRVIVSEGWHLLRRFYEYSGDLSHMSAVNSLPTVCVLTQEAHTYSVYSHRQFQM